MSSSGSKGGRWEGAIFYKCYETDNTVGVKKLLLNAFEFVTSNKKHKKVIGICVYSTKLPLPINNKGTRHHFILLKTKDGGYWAIEKTQSGILVQHSRNVETLLEEDAQGCKRVRLKTVGDCEGFFKPAKGKSIKTVIAWLKTSRQIDQRYNVIEANCIHFAIDLFQLICERRSKELQEVLNSFDGHSRGIKGAIYGGISFIGAVAFAGVIAALSRGNRN